MREDAIGNLDPGDVASGYRAMWCAIKTVGLARELVEVGIKDTPSISASYIRFVLGQSNMGKISSIIADNVNLKRKLEDTNAELASVKKLATEAKKVADAAMSKVTALGRSGGAGRGGGGRGN